MKLSLNWLSDFVTFSEKNPLKIAEALTLSVAEVEDAEVQGDLLDHCCVGKVLALTKHPNADKLSLCEVETDQGKKRVVCGGTNLRLHMLVAFAHTGATVKWHGEEMMKLTKTAIRGEESEGMICAAVELDLTEMFPDSVGHAVIDLGDSGYAVGAPLKEALGFDDIIFHIDNHSITHRADLFSHVGFARECVAIGLGKWKSTSSSLRPWKSKEKLAFGKGKLPFTFVVDAPRLMPRYLSTLIEIDGLGETPEWMKKRLRGVGWRPLNLPVDITNYVATEIGVPLHSFDADDIHGVVHMRTAKKGETIMTLDHVVRTLPEGGMVLSDDNGIFDLLGIMGGLRSSTKEGTRRIYLHSASLDPLTIRRTIIATGHRTDAATVYEKGVPHVIAEQGFYRAAELMLELIPGARLASPLASKGDNGNPKPIELSLAQTSSLLGREITAKEAIKSLIVLGCEVKEAKNALMVKPPLHRLGDIKYPVDLMEEIARVAGFKSFEEEMPEASIAPPKRDHRTNRLRDALKEFGFLEVVQYAFLGEELLKKSGIPITQSRVIDNPLSEDMKIMRGSLLPRLLEYASRNTLIADGALKIFEIGHSFSHHEHQALALLITDASEKTLASEPLLHVKAALVRCLQTINVIPEFKQEHSSMQNAHPGRFASISVHGEYVGALYEVHPTIARNFGLSERTAVLEINLDLLLKTAPEDQIYRDIFEFPSIAYDSTIILDPAIPVGLLLKKTEGVHEFLREVKLVDLFEKEGKRHLTFRCTYNAGERTLKEEEVKPIQEKVEAMLRS
ncbi:MAG TPA: phenylalanine--tRNA ligase subunit beta [Candidatus Peribacterales bacterium]|nr:phenylalanine--tRNA ligase subunit beta [Candidatus Peribacterales bacterium]